MSSLNSNNIALFTKSLTDFVQEEDIISRYIQRFAYGTDASFYRLVPKLVVRINDQTQMIKLIAKANKFNVSLTFRAAGTSLSGQAITDSVLVILSNHWQHCEILAEGEQIKLQVGVIGAQANKTLLPYGRKIGPDPASINSCKIGGIAANNASGMCCGIKHNSYHTLAAITLIFADGTVLDTADEKSIKAFSLRHNQQIIQLQALANKIKQSPELLQRVQHKYRLKNTTGYGINALIDFDDPIEMISHLMIGSEGTLAFIADVTYQTIEIKKYKATGLYLFDDISVACDLVAQLSNERLDAVEILDARALNSVQITLNKLLQFNGANQKTAALLIEFSANDLKALSQCQQQIESHISSTSEHLLPSISFTKDNALISQLWQIRKGMFPAVGANRSAGTTVIIEDVALPLDRLASGVKQLHQLFTQFGYDEAIIFGHALAGNLHFVFTQSFENESEIQRYHDFMAAVSQMIAVDYQGSLKAEHGTGRNMAPFVELEWGTDLYQIMQQIKLIFDPLGLFNPGVIINDNKNCHVENLKAMPVADKLIDSCIECGFCESVCPSTHLTLTPRQRIAVWRRINELQTLVNNSNTANKKTRYSQQLELKTLIKDYQYFGIDSCAATGLCGQQCPVSINTGDFIKTLRSKNMMNSTATKKIAQLLANNFSTLTSITKLGLKGISQLNKVVGDKLTYNSFAAMNRFTSNKIPKWYPAWPTGVNSHLAIQKSQNTTFFDKVVYIPSCANRIFAADNGAEDTRSLPEVMQSILRKAKISIIIPAGINDLCCGMPWESKGLNNIAEQKRQAFIHIMSEASNNGKLPIITDASPCALTINGEMTLDNNNELKIFEASEYIAKFILKKLTIIKSFDTFMLHKTCSSIKMDQGIYLEQIAKACSDNVIIPDNVHCCGFAGDKGFYLPELNKNALIALPDQIPSLCNRGISNSRTCEIGLSEHSKISYQSFLYLLDEVSE